MSERTRLALFWGLVVWGCIGWGVVLVEVAA